MAFSAEKEEKEDGGIGILNDNMALSLERQCKDGKGILNNNIALSLERQCKED